MAEATKQGKAGVSPEEAVKRILANQKEKIKKIQDRDKAKLKKLNAYLQKQKAERFVKAGSDLEKLFKQQGAELDSKAVMALCEKYFK